MIRGLGKEVRPGSKLFCPSWLAPCPSMLQCALAPCLPPCGLLLLPHPQPSRSHVSSAISRVSFQLGGLSPASCRSPPSPVQAWLVSLPLRCPGLQKTTPHFNPLTPHQAKGLNPSKDLPSKALPVLACSAVPYTGPPTASLALLR